MDSVDACVPQKESRTRVIINEVQSITSYSNRLFGMVTEVADRLTGDVAQNVKSEPINDSFGELGQLEYCTTVLRETLAELEAAIKRLENV